MLQILTGDALEQLKTLPDKSVNCCVTSPPYFGLRDYGTASWSGGDAECDHLAPAAHGYAPHETSTLGPNRDGLTPDNSAHSNGVKRQQFKAECGKCNAVRTDSQIGLESTPEEFITTLVAVFAEVRRVLRDDGTLWVNIGDSYAGSWGNYGGQNRGKKGGQREITNGSKAHQESYDGLEGWRPPTAGVTNLPHFVHRLLKGHVLYFGSADPRRSAAQRIHVLFQDQLAPDGVFVPLFTAQRIVVKDGQHYFSEIGGRLDAPVTCWGSSALGLRLPKDASAEILVDIPKHFRIVVTTSDLDTNPTFGISPSSAKKDRKTTLPVEVTGKPVSEVVASDIPAFDAVTVNAGTEGLAQINAIDQPISLLDRSNLSAGLGSDFRIRHASAEQLSLNTHGGTQFCFLGVGHLYSLPSAGIIPFLNTLDEAIQQRNENQPKQELGIPEMLKRALMRDGWICRQTIIWAKPNPMPESVTDRCTKSHEYIFLLSKSPRYFYDHDAIKTPLKETSVARLGQDIEAQEGSARIPGKTNGNMKAVKFGGNNLCPDTRLQSGNNWLPGETANRKSVWTVPTVGLREAHFATFPPKLIEPCILAGCPEGGTVLDPFGGSGTTGMVALKLARKAILIELNPEYVKLIERRCAVTPGLQFA